MDRRDGFGEVVLPLDEDLDGDGRLEFTLDLAIDVKPSRLWVWDFGFTWPTKILSLKIRSVAYNYDLAGNITGETTVFEDEWGPKYEAPLSWSVGAPPIREAWTAQGFETFTFDGALQLTRR